MCRYDADGSAYRPVDQRLTFHFWLPQRDVGYLTTDYTNSGYQPDYQPHERQCSARYPNIGTTWTRVLINLYRDKWNEWNYLRSTINYNFITKGPSRTSPVILAKFSQVGVDKFPRVTISSSVMKPVKFHRLITILLQITVFHATVLLPSDTELTNVISDYASTNGLHSYIFT